MRIVVALGGNALLERGEAPTVENQRRNVAIAAKALAPIAEELAPGAAKVHFVDRLEGEHIVFGYRLHPGVVGEGNALESMRAVGLKV